MHQPLAPFARNGREQVAVHSGNSVPKNSGRTHRSAVRFSVVSCRSCPAHLLPHAWLIVAAFSPSFAFVVSRQRAEGAGRQNSTWGSRAACALPVLVSPRSPACPPLSSLPCPLRRAHGRGSESSLHLVALVLLRWLLQGVSSGGSSTTSACAAVRVAGGPQIFRCVRGRQHVRKIFPRNRLASGHRRSD